MFINCVVTEKSLLKTDIAVKVRKLFKSRKFNHFNQLSHELYKNT